MAYLTSVLLLKYSIIILYSNKSFFVLQRLTSFKLIIHGSDLLHLDLTLLYANWLDIVKNK